MADRAAMRTTKLERNITANTLFIKDMLGRSTLLSLTLLASSVCWAAQKPELVVRTGHSEGVMSVVFSADGSLLASGGDHTIKLWDVTTGGELRTLSGHSDKVLSVAFSPDGKTLASGSGGSENTVKLWDVMSGNELYTLRGHSYFVWSVAFSPDGKTLASGSYDSTIKLWDVTSGRELRTIKGHSRGIRSVAFSVDGKMLASGGDPIVELWDVTSGRELRTLKGRSSWVGSVAFSADSKTLASGGDQIVELWDVTSGKELRTLKGHSGGINSVAFSPDGLTLASGSTDHTIKLWDVMSGSELHTLKGHSDSLWSVAFSPDGKTLASGAGRPDNSVKLWDVTSGSELRTLKGHSHWVSSVVFSPDGRTLASGNKTISLWDLKSGGLLRTFKGHPDSLYSVAFSPDGKMLASSGNDGRYKLWDVTSGKEVRTLDMHSSSVYSVAFSPDGNTVASGNYDKTIKLCDVTTGSELRTLTGHSGPVNSVAFSADGKTLASGSSDNTIKLWDVNSGSELRTLRGHSSAVWPVAFSADGKMLASGSYDKTIKLWDPASGRDLRTLSGHSGGVYSLAFSADGKTLASGGDDNAIKMWDVASGHELRTLRGHSFVVVSLAFSPDGKTLASGSGDATVRVWDLSSGKELGRLIGIDENDWLVVTPEGLFDGSPNGWEKILWRLSNNTFDYAPVEAFFKEYWRPGLLASIMTGERPEPPNKDLSTIDIREPQLRITSVDGQAPVEQALGKPVKLANAVSNRKVEIRIEVTDNTKSVPRSDLSHPPSSGAKDLRLFRNGSLVQLWQGDIFGRRQGDKSEDAKQNECEVETSKPDEPRRAICKATVSIVAGDNNFSAYGFNHDDVKSTDATLTVIGAESLRRKGVAYVLAVGVNEYANSEYNLKYAVADAQDFAAEVKLQQDRLKNYERVEVTSLNDRDAKKANILKSLTDLTARIQPEDALVIFVAGHGTAQHNRFYLVPHDLGYSGSRTQLDSMGLQKILANSISDEELERAVEGIDAGQLILIIDACNSGQALEAEEKRRGPMNSKGLAQLAYEKGMYILTAAQSYQAANEAERYGHGFLTYALVEEGLKTNAADREPNDGQVLLREWLDFATARVPEMQQEKLDEQRKQGRGLNIIKFSEADSGNERSIQRPRVFYRREAETHPLVVAKP